MLYQVYNPVEAQRIIMKLGERFLCVRKNPKSKMFQIYTTEAELFRGVSLDFEEILSITTFVYPMNEYVYDLETGFHFQTGIGMCIVHNTDSVMVSCPDEWSKEQTFANSLALAEEITDSLFTKPCKLEFEKVFYPYFLKGKKMYAGLMAETVSEELKLQIKGLFLVRRETPDVVREFGFRILHLMLRENNSFQVLQELKTYVENVLDGKIPLQKFVKTMSIQAEECYKTTSAVRSLATTVNDRLGYTEYFPGDRVKFIQIVPPSTVEKLSKQTFLSWGKGKGKKEERKFYISTRDVPQLLKIEDPAYVEKHNLLVDYEYYLEVLEKKTMDLLQFESVRVAVQEYFNQVLRKFRTADFKPPPKKRTEQRNLENSLLRQQSNKKMKTMYDFYPKKMLELKK